MIPIKYIGQKPSKEDNVAMTGLVWKPGQVHVVSASIANKLLKFPTVWVVAEDEEAAMAQPSVVAEAKVEEQTPDSVALPNFVGMTKKQIADFALVAFGVALEDSINKPEMIRMCVDLQNVHETALKLEQTGGVRKASKELEDATQKIVEPGPPREENPMRIAGHIDEIPPEKPEEQKKPEPAETE